MSIRVRKIRKIIIMDILLLIVMISMLALVKCRKRDAFSFKGEYKTLSLTGKWYKVDLDEISVVSITKDGKYEERDMSDKLVKSGTYEIGNHVMRFDENIFSMNYVDEESQYKENIKNDDLSEYELRKYFYITDSEGEKIYYFSNDTAASDQVEDNCSTNEYYQKTRLFDENGFAIDGDGVLLAYTGDAKEVTIPSDVTEIAENAMSADYGRAENTEKITIPSTVKKISSGAFSFSNVKKVYIEQGVEEIDTWAFGDSNIEEIHFPKSVKSLREGILDTEEGLEGLKIYCQKDSQVEQYFKDNQPEGEYQIIYT
jgi:hypothetical protein